MSHSNGNREEYLYSAVTQEIKDKLTVEENVEPAPKLGKRHLQVLMYFLIGFIGFTFRVSLSVAIVAMTDPAVSSNPDIPTYPEWTDKNVILSAFFWGYMIPQIFAGWAASNYGAKWFLVGTFSLQSMLSILTPYTAAHLGSKGLIASRALQGLCQGFIYPSLTHLLSQWVPPSERSRLGTIVYAAGPCGTVVTMFVTGYISASSYGWPLAFYVTGALGFMWVAAFIFVGYDSPAQHPSISLAEKLYIETGLGHTDEKAVHPTPWKAIATSVPLWALFASQTGNNFCFWTLLTQIPTYMNYVMHFNIKDNSLLSSLPYLTMWLMSFVVGFTSDAIINRKILTRTTSRKIFNFLGLLTPAAALIMLGFTQSNQSTQAVILLILAVGSNAFAFAGWAVNHMDLSPNHSGTLMGLCNGFSQFTGAAAPLVVQTFVKNQTDPVQWRTIFLITATLNIVTATIFGVFGSAEVQPWNDNQEKKEKA